MDGRGDTRHTESEGRLTHQFGYSAPDRTPSDVLFFDFFSDVLGVLRLCVADMASRQAEPSIPPRRTQPALCSSNQTWCYCDLIYVFKTRKVRSRDTPK